MQRHDAFARLRFLAEQERLLLASLRQTIPDPQVREPIEQAVREGFRRERRLSRNSTGSSNTGCSKDDPGAGPGLPNTQMTQ
jgi:hypothetical protein